MTLSKGSKASTRYRCTRRTTLWLQICKWWIWIPLKTKETSLNWVKKEGQEMVVPLKVKEGTPRVHLQIITEVAAVESWNKTPVVLMWAPQCKMLMKSSRFWTSSNSKWCKCRCKTKMDSLTTQLIKVEATNQGLTIHSAANKSKLSTSRNTSSSSRCIPRPIGSSSPPQRTRIDPLDNSSKWSRSSRYSSKFSSTMIM